MDEVRILEIKQSVFANNDQRAELLRRELKEKRIFLLNLMSSPGSGKTTTLTAPTLTTLWFRQTTVITCAAGLTDCIPPPERCFWMSAAALPRQTPPERPMP